MTFEPSEEKLFVQFKGHICDQWSWDGQCNYCSGEVLLEVYLGEWSIEEVVACREGRDPSWV